MGRYVPRSGWAEQKTSRESCCGKTANHHTCQPEFRRAKNCSFALRRLGQNREAKRVRRSLPASDHPGVSRVGSNRNTSAATSTPIPPKKCEINDCPFPRGRKGIAVIRCQYCPPSTGCLSPLRKPWIRVASSSAMFQAIQCSPPSTICN
jgi:hypothetical protein